MLAVPDQHPAAGGILPEIGVLVLVQGVHAVVAVDVGVQELDAVVQHGVPLAHGQTVDVGAHGGVQRDARLGKPFPPGRQAAGKDAAVQQVGEVQVVGRKAQPPLRGQRKKLLLLLGGGGAEEFLHAVQRFAVPAEIRVGIVLHQAQGAADVVHLQGDDVLLQIGVANVGVGVMHDVNGADGMWFHTQKPHFVVLYKVSGPLRSGSGCCPQGSSFRCIRSIVRQRCGR